MSLYSADVTITNNSGSNLILDQSDSSGLGDGDWPLLIPPGGTQVVTQTGAVNLNWRAVYTVEGNKAQAVTLHFYLAVFALGYVDIALLPDGVSLGPDSSVSLFGEGLDPDTNNTTWSLQRGPSTGVTSGQKSMTYVIGRLQAA